MNSNEQLTITTCHLCRQNYDNALHLPKVASCGHNICKECAHDIHNVICPFCSKPTLDNDKLAVNTLALAYLHELESCRKKIKQLEFHINARDAPISPVPRIETMNISDDRLPNLNLPSSSRSKPQKNKKTPKPAYEGNKITIKNINPAWTVPDINEMFCIYGRIINTFPKRDIDGNLFGFDIVFEENAEAKAAIEVMNNAPNDCGGKIAVFYNKFKPNNNRPNNKPQDKWFLPERTVTVSPLGNIDKNELERIFSEHGPILRSRLCTDLAGSLMGYALIEYQNHVSVEEAIKFKSCTRLPGSEVKIIVDEYVPKHQF